LLDILFDSKKLSILVTVGIVAGNFIVVQGYPGKGAPEKIVDYYVSPVSCVLSLSKR